MYIMMLSLEESFDRTGSGWVVEGVGAVLDDESERWPKLTCISERRTTIARQRLGWAAG